MPITKARKTKSRQETTTRPVRIGIVGYGYWGPNLARNIAEVPNAELVQIVEQNQARRELAQKRYSRISTSEHFTSILKNKEVDAVFLATPISTHYELAKASLLAGKHVLVAKPITSSVEEAEELIELAERQKCVLMVDHTFIYTGAVQKMKEIVKSGVLGEIFYFDSVRINLGLFQNDLNVVWDLAPHDLSILTYVLARMPISLIATGAAHSNQRLENTAYISMELPDNIIAHIHVNWLSPVKVRRTILGGSKKMLIFDDLEADEKIKIYDRGVEISNFNKEGLYKTLFQYRTGDMWAPTLEKTEALKTECEHFARCIQEGVRPITGGQEGLQIVRILEAIEKSLRSNGKRVNV